MPLYGFVCKCCGDSDERFVSLADFDVQVHRQKCLQCGGMMRKLIGVPALRTDTEFMSGAGVASDGLYDAFSRRIAYAKAHAAGVNISGKKFHPGLCRTGVPLDPHAWYGSEQEVKQKVERLGRCVQGRVNHVSPVRDVDLAKIEQPYRVSAEAVREEVNQEIREKHNGRATKRQRAEITERIRDECTPKKLGRTGRKVSLIG